MTTSSKTSSKRSRRQSHTPGEELDNDQNDVQSQQDRRDTNKVDKTTHENIYLMEHDQENGIAAPSTTTATSPDPRSLCTVHRCRSITLTPSSITALAFSSTTQLLAIARNCGTIELFDCSHMLITKVIYGNGDMHIQSMVWHHNRLFTGSLNGRLIQWSLSLLLPYKSSDSYGGGIWSIALHPDSDRIAASCEDGSVRIFDVSTDELMYVKALSVGCNSRALSVDWNDDGTKLVSAHSDGSIRIHLYNTAQVFQRLQSDTDLLSKTAAIWSVKWLKSCNQLVTGSSTGAVQFWELAHGTLSQTFTHHTADVLSLAITGNGTTVYSGSADQSICEIKYVDGRWRTTSAHRIHTHDVYALAVGPPIIATPGPNSVYNITDSWLASGGVDTQLSLSRTNSFSSRRAIKLLPFGQINCVSSSRNLFLVRHRHSLSLYRLGKYTKAQNLELMLDEPLPLQSPCSHLLEIDLNRTRDPADPWSAPSPLFIHCSNLSSDGKWIICGDALRVRLFHIVEGKVKSIPLSDLKTGATSLCFTENGHAVICGTDNVISVLGLKDFRVVNRVTFARGNERSGLLNFVAVSTNSSWCSVCDEFNIIHVYSLANLSYHCILPKFNSPTTAMAFHPYNGSLIVVTASNEFYLFDCEKEQLTEWSRQHSYFLPSTLLKRNEKIINITFDHTAHSTFCLQSLNWLCIVDLSLPFAATSNLKTQRERQNRMKKSSKKMRSELAIEESKNEENTIIEHKSSIRIISNYKSMIYGGYTNYGLHGERTAVVIECPWFNILQNLEEPMQRKRYGT